jgi:hypothetical protein
MKLFLVVPRQLAVLVAAAAIGMAYQGDTRAPNMASHIKHAPVQVHRNDDGSLARGRNNEITTSNWSGYAVANFETGQSYNAAQATWTVPGVTFDSADKSGAVADYSSTWVGIGGYCENPLCTKVDRSLIQLGTEQDVSSAGVTTYSSWYELLPQFPVVMPTDTYPVTPGDVITASLQCNNPCPRRNQSWTLTMSNAPGPNSHYLAWQWSTKVTYTSSKLSAVWIEEAPSSAGGILPLADFGTATIDPDLGNESTPSLSLATNGILMADPWGQTANPSAPGAASFNVCWGSGGAFTSCPAP